jgi:hypothetical protein
LVYKGVGLSVRKGNDTRDNLKAQGLIAELAVSTTDAGRPMKFFIPTLKAFELLGTAPPTGRGGAVHRYIQQLVGEGATAKGYSAQVEKDLGNGGIVDVHLERDGVRIACEIAVVSKPQREIAHIKNCLAVGYEQVFAIFVDEYLMARTQEALSSALSAEELGKVRLVPLGKLSGMV